MLKRCETFFSWEIPFIALSDFIASPVSQLSLLYQMPKPRSTCSQMSNAKGWAWEGDAEKNPAWCFQPSEHLTLPGVCRSSRIENNVQGHLGKGIPPTEEPAIFTSASRKGRIEFPTPSSKTHCQTQ